LKTKNTLHLTTYIVATAYYTSHV